MVSSGELSEMSPAPWLAGAILLLVAHGCAMGPSFELVRFEQGKMQKDEFGNWFIYEHGRELQYAENGQCVVAGESKPCMWHGFVLEYRTDADQISLDCVHRSNKHGDYVNPTEVLAESANEAPFTLTLRGSETEFRNPQYVGGSMLNWEVHRTRTECRVNGSIVLKFETIIRLGPPSAQPL